MTPERKRILDQIGKPGAVLCLFTSMQQMATITDGCFGEESQFFLDKMKEYAERIENMPKTYEQDGMGDEAIAYLHYFIGGCDWYITEKDKGSADDERPGAQLQAFGLVKLNNNEPELGYINIEEVTSCGAELDLHFTPCTLAEVRHHLIMQYSSDQEVLVDEDENQLNELDLLALIGKAVTQ